MKKKIFILLAVLLIPLLAIFILARVFYPDNIAETAPDGGKKYLKTRIYKTDLPTAENVVKEIVPTLTTYGSNWKLIAVEDAQNGQKIIKVEVPVVIFTDDLQVTLKKGAGEGETEVNVRSASRVGKSDFGENHRHVVKLLEALDKRFLNAR
jgi:uncharacterized protein (DUF1499 family)